jgi:hypothetical protein
MDGSRITAPHAGARAKAGRRLPVSVTLPATADVAAGCGAAEEIDSTFEVPASTIPQLRSSSNGGTLATRRPSRSAERA